MNAPFNRDPSAGKGCCDVDGISAPAIPAHHEAVIMAALVVTAGLALAAR
jgi:hypothetical protein